MFTDLSQIPKDTLSDCRKVANSFYKNRINCSAAEFVNRSYETKKEIQSILFKGGVNVSETELNIYKFVDYDAYYK